MRDNSSTETLLERLIEASTFGLDDLQENRRGRMSGLQRSRLAVMAVLYSGASALTFSGAGIAIWFYGGQPRSFPLLAAMAWVIFCTLAGAAWLREAIQMWEDVRANKVRRISGPIRHFYTPGSGWGRGPVHTLHYRIANRFFDMAFFAPKMFRENQSCRAYYAPRSNILVGIEPI
jgi:hypothetical protein